MNKTVFRGAFAFLLAAMLSAPVIADVKTEEKGLVTFTGMLGRLAGMLGGQVAKEGMVSTVAVKGNRKSRLNEVNGEIIDLAEEKVYQLDMKKKTYTVTTFDELRRRLKEAQDKTKVEVQKSEPEPDNSAKQMEVDFNIKETDQKKTINGFDTQQVIATVTVREKGKKLEESGGLILTSDMWLTPTIKSLKEISDFDRRYWEKIAGPTVVDPQQMAAAMAMYPFLKDAMARLEAEKGKADGTAIVTILTIESVKSQADMSAKPENSGGSPTNVGGLLGGLGRRATRRKEDDAPQARSTFMTSTREVLKVSNDVVAGDVAIPMGFVEKK
jgi:hypothetical protein